MDEYAEVLKNVSKSKLKLKTDIDKSKKKKKKSKDKDKDKDKISMTSLETIKIVGTSSGSSGIQYTKAELAFKKQQEEIKNKRIMEKAKMTHKQKVEKFNEHLDSLSEHFDIQKVSWTK